MELVIGLGCQFTKMSHRRCWVCNPFGSLRLGDFALTAVAGSRRDGAEELVGGSYSRDVDDHGNGVGEICEICPRASCQ